MKVIACMSGTSLDGLDVALCEIAQKSDQFFYEILYAETYSFDEILREKLIHAMEMKGKDLAYLDDELGYWIAEKIDNFTRKNNIESYDYISSHGHTVFHDPKNKFTKQIGSGVVIASKTNKPVLFDFRSLDVALGGQGAPLVPIGDKLLFPAYDYCLNLGGFSNVSFEDKTQRIAFDIAPVNIVINQLVRPLGVAYDSEGSIGREGEVIPELLNQLNRLEYYHQDYPKSLGKEWVDEYIQPLLNDYSKLEDVIRTMYEHAAYQIGRVLNKDNSRTLVTGGGAYNTFLLERIEYYSNSEIVVPEKLLVEYKEALIFALLAFLRVNELDNTLSSVTGAERDSSGGLIAFP